ncbi:hypothetical protein N7462_009276 [Penicillium macrosclerotiorum]|uniref:uncharacterized protein n=1 Tax=Penicillium macrosclerotiorum TaxID=303699 RepID=UPI002547AAB4|nr:uncharacterized protein N7462_009276 [Penicillium macrosclerotiorum]KAJ5673837.1 hypothetical protein N7462_009276 [Penicillium macrosclerotiorum]
MDGDDGKNKHGQHAGWHSKQTLCALNIGTVPPNVSSKMESCEKADTGTFHGSDDDLDKNCHDVDPQAPPRKTPAFLGRSEIKRLACLCFCLALWLTGIPDMMARMLGRSARAGQNQGCSTPDRTLRFTKDGTFQISVFEDLHFAEDSRKDVKTQHVMKYVLAKEKPQLVVINGDLVSGEATKASSSSQYLHQVVSPLLDGGYLWASTYGNHDSNPNLDPRQDEYDQEKRYKNSLTQKLISDPMAGVTNYYLPVFSHDGSESDIPTLLLWFFDSRGGREPINRVPNGRSGRRGDWVDQSVVDWFIKTNSDLTSKYGHSIPSLAFYHIPADAMRTYQDNGVDSRKSPGLNGETVVQQGSGDTPYTGQDIAFMQALLNTSGLMATFSGHDHENDWCFKWDGKTVSQNLAGNGLNMCYGRHTGYGGYGNAMRGGRQILLKQENLVDDVETWVRLEDGTVSAHVTLNGTYGQDDYSKIHRRAIGSMEGGASRRLSHLGSLWYSMVGLWLPVFILWHWKCSY